MKRFARLVAMVLIFACLSVCLLACDLGGKTNSNNTNTNSNHSTDTDDGGSTEPEVRDPSLPEIMDFGTDGEPYLYKALVRTGVDGAKESDQLVWGNNGYACIDFYVGEDGSRADAISYAVYHRNSRIQDDYNCRIKQESQNGDMTSQLKLAYMDSEKFDLTIIMAKAAANAATQNLLTNLKDMSHLDLTHPAYDENSIKELAIGDYLYYLSGDMNVSTMEVCGPTIVNLEMYNDYIDTFVQLFKDPSFSNIYSLVQNKKWTIDTMLTMANAINVDVDDSDDQLLGSQPGDVVGYFAYTGMGVYYYYGSGARLSEHNDEGIPELVFQKQKNVDLYNYLFTKFNTNTGDNAAWLPHGLSGVRQDIFFSGRCLFTEMTLFDVRKTLYEAEPFQYGILPNPTYEANSDYHSVVYFTNCNHLWAIPSMVNDAEVAALMMNIFAAYSNVELKDSTMYAYYERTLYLNTASDEGSRAAMNIIKNSMVYDIALLYDWSDLGRIMLGELTVGELSTHTANVKNANSITKYRLAPTIEKFKNPTMS